MFLRDRRPRSAVHLLCNAAAGCSVAGLALLAEERRRRIALAQKIVENGRRLQAYKAYHGNAAIAVFEDDLSCHFDPGEAPTPRAVLPLYSSNEPHNHTLTHEEWRGRGRLKASLPKCADILATRSSSPTLELSEEPFPLDRWKTRMHATEQGIPTNITPPEKSLNVSSIPIVSEPSAVCETRRRLFELAGQRIFSDKRVKRARAVHKIQLALKDGIKARLARAETEAARLRAYAELYFYFALHHEAISAPLRDFVDHLRGCKGDRSTAERNGKTWQTLSHDMRAVIEQACNLAQHTTSRASYASKLTLNLREEPPTSRQKTLVKSLLHLIRSQRPDEAYLALTMACPTLIGPIEPALRSCVRLIIDTFKAIGCSTLVLELHKTISSISEDVTLFGQDLDFLLGQESGLMRLYVCQTLLNSSVSGLPPRSAAPAFVEACLEWLLANDGCAAAAFVFTRLSTGRVPIDNSLMDKTLPAIGNRIKHQAHHENDANLIDSVEKVLSNHELRKLRHAEGIYRRATTSGSPRQMQGSLLTLSETLASKDMQRRLSASVRLGRLIDSSHELLLKRMWAMTNNLSLLEHSYSQIKPILAFTQGSPKVFQAMGTIYAAVGHRAQADHYSILAQNFTQIPSSIATAENVLAKSHHEVSMTVEGRSQEPHADVVCPLSQPHEARRFENVLQRTCLQNNPQRTIELAMKLHLSHKAELTPYMCQMIMHSLIHEEQLEPCSQWLDFCRTANLDLHLGYATLSLICDRLGLFTGAGTLTPLQEQNDFRFALVLHFLRNAQVINARLGHIERPGMRVVSPAPLLPSPTTTKLGDAQEVGGFTIRRHGNVGADKTVNDETARANNTIRAMRRAMAAGKPANALDIYHEAIVDNFPLRPSLLSAAVNATMATNKNSTREALELIRAAESQGLCATTARQVALILELGDIPMSEVEARSIVFGEHKLLTNSCLSLDHLIFQAVAQRLALQQQPNAILRLCEEAYSSPRVKERPFSRWLVVELLKLFIATDYMAGVLWIHNTVYRSMRPTRHYLTTLQQAHSKTKSPLVAKICVEAEQRREQQKAHSRHFLEQFALLLRR